MAFHSDHLLSVPYVDPTDPAFINGAHFRFKPLQTSHLESNLICQHPISVLSCSHAAGLILQYGLDMGHFRYSAANRRHAVWHRRRPAAWEPDEQIQYSELLVCAIPVILWLTLRTICLLIPHFAGDARTCSPKHTEVKT